ncbi:endonuclease [Rubrivivax gelatinosus]|nr:endonuclease [Rubrivivax gelatinosus]
MATYAQLQQQIMLLEAEAQKLKRSERAEVVARLRADIAAWELTPQELFGRGARRVVPAEEARYRDGSGRVWGGRGPRPHWLREALAAGARLEDFRVGATPVPEKPAAPAPKKNGRGGKPR